MREYLATLSASTSVQQLLGLAGVFFIKSVLLVKGRNKDESPMRNRHQERWVRCSSTHISE
ncbi:hypothetical protein E2C01_025240 [Portunus trituberculatus]|uniref:Uncharacterized protein n=1 Tax=Portunus trituberculatus TaxID=210409 RepID=A0A5B7ECG1_PORTR|nr:hypothetical protein [Portunus trituberculatus]